MKHDDVNIQECLISIKKKFDSFDTQTDKICESFRNIEKMQDFQNILFPRIEDRCPREEKDTSGITGINEPKISESDHSQQQKWLKVHLSKPRGVSLRDNMVAQKASTIFSSDSPNFSDHFHLLLSIVVMYN
jgi:hypothetical protein